MNTFKKYFKKIEVKPKYLHFAGYLTLVMMPHSHAFGYWILFLAASIHLAEE